MNKKIMSVVLSAFSVFYAATASAAERFEQEVSNAVLENANIEINFEIDEKDLPNPAKERFDIAESINEISKEEIPQYNNTYQISHSQDDIYWLSRIIEAEASGESMEGKIAVGNCVLNRVNSSEFPNTIYEVIFDKKHGVQYQPTANGMIYNTPSDESVKAAIDSLGGKSVVGDAMYFCTTKVAPVSWAGQNRPYLTTIGNHTFFL